MRLARLLLIGALSMAIAACAGFRGGWRSVPYMGDEPPVAPAGAEVPSRHSEMPMLQLPGLQLQVALDNVLQTYDTQVYLFFLPLSVDPRRTYPDRNDPHRTRVFLTIIPAEPGFVFRPMNAMLRVGDQRFAATMGHVSGRWDGTGGPVEEGGTWDRRQLAGEFALDEAGKRYQLSIDFPAAAVEPESKDIVIDLSRALTSPRHQPLPLIRFAPVRWKEGYTQQAVPGAKPHAGKIAAAGWRIRPVPG